jgi:hypothetical protein
MKKVPRSKLMGYSEEIYLIFSKDSPGAGNGI